MAPFSRREFLFLGAATGAATAIGILIPVSIIVRDNNDGSVGTTTTTLAAGPAAVVAFFPEVTVAQVSQLQSGVPVDFDYPLVGQKNLLVKMGEEVVGGVGGEGDIVAFSRICTHMGCEIGEYRHHHKALGPCPCHFSTFDLIHGGQVALGQATQSLPQILLKVDGDDVVATGVVRLVYGFNNTLQGRELVSS